MAEKGDEKITDVLIRLENVSKTFARRGEEVTAVKDCSFTVRKGEVLTLVGASGCGKTTILNMIAGFTPPSSGAIFLDDAPITGVEPRCGMIFQSYELFPWLTVRGNVEFGPKLNGVPKTERRDLAQEYIKMVGLEGFEDAYPGELSGGMRQRVALSRAMANKPEVLLCDEPFAALDAMTRQVMQQELLRIVRQSGQTVLFITHSIDEAIILSDRVIVMSARPGRVKAFYDIELPRPRTVEMQLIEQYMEYKRKIWSLVEEEVMASIGQR
ncbi:MAG: ABC transporter ATP-binding protein [Nitrospinota bacterium]